MRFRGIAQLVEQRSPKPRAEGSNPSAPAIKVFTTSVVCDIINNAVQMARQFSWLERQPVTLEVDGSSPFRVATFFASVAQLVEQRTENPRVVGSIPTGGTMDESSSRLIHFLCGCSSSGRAPPCQGGGSEFEPRHPLHFFIWRHSQVVRRGSATP